MDKIRLRYVNDPYKINDIQIHENIRFEDSRGYLDIQFELQDIILPPADLSLKSSFSEKGIARGLHWQNLNHPQTKIIKVIKGEILLCLVNMKEMREGFLFRYTEDHHFSIEISTILAHGFYTLKPTTFQYICFGKYSEADEITLNLFPEICKELDMEKLEISKKDTAFPSHPVTIIQE